MFLTLTRTSTGQPVLIDTHAMTVDSTQPGGDGCNVSTPTSRLNVRQPLDLITAALAGYVHDPLHTGTPTHLDLTTTYTLTAEDQHGTTHHRYTWTHPSGAWTHAAALYRQHRDSHIYANTSPGLFPRHDPDQPGALIADGITYTVTATTH